MKIVTWNINSIRLRLDLIRALRDLVDFDLLLLQETKCTNEQFPLQEIVNMGFKDCIYDGEKSYNGVAIIAKRKIENKFSLKLYNDDTRHIACFVDDVEIHNFYVPAGGDIPDIHLNKKYLHKLSYVKLMEEWFENNRNSKNKIIIAGDLNIAPFEHDVWSSKQLDNVISHTKAEKDNLNALRINCHFTDSARYFIPSNEKLYTWWSYRNKDWQKSNRGRRLDHIWVSNNLVAKMKEITVLKEARNWSSPSDHVPYILNIDLEKT